MSAEIYIVASEDGNLIRIVNEEAEGFLCHPRTGAIIAQTLPPGRMVNGTGFDPQGGALPGRPRMYPLVDDDHGTRLIALDGGEWKLTKDPPENYGNVDWKGSQDEILTWRGPPSRIFPLDPLVEYPGFTVEEEVVGEVFYYTSFGPNVYRSGSIYDTAPSLGVSDTKVLGAALAKADGALLVILGTNYRDIANPADATGGFFFEAWKKGAEWTRLGYLQGERAKVPWFFNASGTEAQTVQGYVRYKVVIAEAVATFSQSSTIVTESVATIQSTASQEELDCIGPRMPEPPGAEALELGYHLSGTCRIQQRGKRLIAVDYKGDVEVERFAEVNNVTESSYDSVKQGYSTESIAVPNEPSGMPYPSAPTLYVENIVGYQDAASISHGGFCGTPLFAVTCGEISEDNSSITGLSCCTDGDVTITGSDENGCRTVEYTFNIDHIVPVGYPGSWEFRFPQGCGVYCGGEQYAPTTVYVMGAIVDDGIGTISESWPGCGYGVTCGSDLRIIAYGVGYDYYFSFERYAGRDEYGTKLVSYSHAKILGQYTVPACP
jgi:hypothetical protein